MADSLGEDVIALCPGLRLVVCPYAGTERIHREALPPDVTVINGGGTEEPIADRMLRAGEWSFTSWGSGHVEERERA